MNTLSPENNQNLVTTDIRMLGNSTTICQIVQLLAYIRHAIQTNTQYNIQVLIGNNVANSEFTFDVNGMEVQDYIPKPTIEIN